MPRRSRVRTSSFTIVAVFLLRPVANNWALETVKHHDQLDLGSNGLRDLGLIDSWFRVAACQGHSDQDQGDAYEHGL